MKKAQKERDQMNAKARKQADRQTKQELRRARHNRKYGDDEWKSDWRKFIEQLALIGLTIKDVAGDGNCMFRALADQLEGEPNKHDTYRQRICDFMERQQEDFAPFVEDDRTLDQHLAEMRKNATWGGHMELQAASLLLNCNICIHQLAQPRWEIVNHFGTPKSPPRTIHMSYHEGQHYASVRNSDDLVNRPGPPTPIRLTPQAAVASTSTTTTAETVGSGECSWQEELVLRSTCATNVFFVRAVLLEVGGDKDAAIEYIISLAPDGELDETFQAEFAFEHGIVPPELLDDLPDYAASSSSPFGGDFAGDDFDPSLLRFAADVDLVPELSSSSPPQKTDSHSDKQHKPKKGNESASSSRSSAVSKLERFQNPHLSNKQRNALKRMEKETPPPVVVEPTPPPQNNPTQDPSEASAQPDLGSLRI